MSASSGPENPNQQLLALRDLFRRTGAVHELQRINLWAWAELAAPHLVPSQVEVKPESYEVVFDYEQNRKVLKFFRMQPPKNFAARLEGLADAVQVMFGADFAVLVRAEGTLIFSSGRKAAPTARPEYTGVDFEAGRIVPKTPWKFPKTAPKKKP